MTFTGDSRLCRMSQRVVRRVCRSCRSVFVGEEYSWALSGVCRCPISRALGAFTVLSDWFHVFGSHLSLSCLIRKVIINTIPKFRIYIKVAFGGIVNIYRRRTDSASSLEYPTTTAPATTTRPIFHDLYLSRLKPFATQTFRDSTFSRFKPFATQTFHDSNLSRFKPFTTQTFRDSKFSRLKIFTTQTFHDSKFSWLKTPKPKDLTWPPSPQLHT